jgi:hypothetical protein
MLTHHHDRRIGEFRLRFLERLETARRLADDVGPELQEVASAMVSATDRAVSSALDSSACSDLDEIRKGLTHLSTITRRLWALRGSGTVLLAPTNVNVVVWQLETTLTAVLPEGVKLDVRVMSCGLAETHPARLEQTITELVGALTNSSLGALTLATRDCDEVPHSETSVFTRGAYVTLTLAASGVVLDDYERVVVFATLCELGDAVTVHSTPDAGTRIEIFMRRVDGVR